MTYRLQVMLTTKVLNLTYTSPKVAKAVYDHYAKSKKLVYIKYDEVSKLGEVTQSYTYWPDWAA